MNRIGLLTFHRTTNFGSCLQTYGLYKKIVDLGYECEIIDYRCPAIEEREKLENQGIKSLKAVAKFVLLQPAINRKARALADFTNENMRVSHAYTPDTIASCASEYSKIIVGSDIVWGRDITRDDYTYFLDFVHEKGKKYAFASSVGNEIIREDETRLKNLLRAFQDIAVREENAVRWVRELSGREAEWVCDPTMLISAKEWRKAIPPKKKYNNYVLVYFDNSSKKAIKDAICYGQKHNKKVLVINYAIPERNVINIKPETLSEFLGLIQYADRVFTASYHGMLFSIYFEKQFSFYTREHSSRVLSLAKRLGLSDQCRDQAAIDEYKLIDYPQVKVRVAEFKKYSEAVLLRMLEGEGTIKENNTKLSKNGSTF